MLKNISNFGQVLNKEELKFIKGGTSCATMCQLCAQICGHANNQTLMFYTVCDCDQPNL
jgi:hypothetical protein